MTRHFLDLWRLDASTIRAILDDAARRKAARAGWTQGRIDADAPGAGRTLAMVFEKNSTRTRFSFDAAIRQLGGSSIIANASDMQLGRGEPVEDTARVLSRMVDAVMIRAIRHDDVERFAQVATVPVINGLTDRSHPCQVLADILTIEEHRGPLAGLTLAWVGDGNNVCASLIHAVGKLGGRLKIACPADYHPDLHDLARANLRGLFGLHVGGQVGDRLLHHTSRFHHLRKKHLARAEEIANDAHAVHQRAFDHQQRPAELLVGLLGVQLNIGVDTFDQRVREPLLDRAGAPTPRSSSPRLCCRRP